MPGRVNRSTACGQPSLTARDAAGYTQAMTKLGLGLFFAFAVAACGDSGGGDSALVGTWKHLAEDGVTVEDEYVFGADGSFRFDEHKPATPAQEDHLSGTWTLDGDTLQASGTNSRNQSMGMMKATIYVSAETNTLLVGAMLPQGEHDGIAGTWRGELSLTTTVAGQTNSIGSTSTYTFRADQTVTIVQDAPGMPTATFQGTWTNTGDDYTAQIVQANATLNIRVTLVDGAALGSSIYRK